MTEITKSTKNLANSSDVFKSEHACQRIDNTGFMLGAILTVFGFFVVIVSLVWSDKSDQDEDIILTRIERLQTTTMGNIKQLREDNRILLETINKLNEK